MGCGNSKGSTAVENQTGSSADTNNHQAGEQPGKVMNGPDKTTQEPQDSNKHIEDQQNTDSSPKEEVVENGEEKKDAEKPANIAESEDRTTEESAPEQTPEQEETKPVVTEEETPVTQASEEVAQPEVVKEEEEVTREEEVMKAEEVTQAEEVTEPATEGSTEEPAAAPAAEETEEKPAEEPTEAKPAEEPTEAKPAEEPTEEVTGNEGENPATSDLNELQLDEDSAVDMEIQAVEIQAEAEEEANTAPVTASPKNDEQSAFNEPNVPSDDGPTSSPSAETGEHKVEVPLLHNDTKMTDNEVNVADDIQVQSDEQTTTIEDAPVTDGNKDAQAEGGEAVPEAASVEDARGSPTKDEGETVGEGEQAKADGEEQAAE